MVSRYILAIMHRLRACFSISDMHVSTLCSIRSRCSFWYPLETSKLSKSVWRRRFKYRFLTNSHSKSRSSESSSTSNRLLGRSTFQCDNFDDKSSNDFMVSDSTINVMLATRKIKQFFFYMPRRY